MSGDSEHQLRCNTCKSDKYHRLLHRETKSGSEPIDVDFSVDWSTDFEMWQCKGCKEILYRTHRWFSEWQDGGPDPVYEDSYFPPREFRSKPPWFENLPDNFKPVLSELYIALQNDLPYLASFGARTALDLILVEKVRDKGGFEQKLQSLEDKGHITEDERPLLEALVNAGNAAAHRGFKPIKTDLVTIMDILENVLQKLYISPEDAKDLASRAEQLNTNVPSRD